MAVSAKKESTDKQFDFGFYLVLIFLLFEYGRPQSFWPVIGSLYPGWIIQILLILCLVVKNKSFNFSNVQTKCFFALVLF